MEVVSRRVEENLRDHARPLAIRLPRGTEQNARAVFADQERSTKPVRALVEDRGSTRSDFMCRRRPFLVANSIRGRRELCDAAIPCAANVP
jgi:hypothetical protein